MRVAMGSDHGGYNLRLVVKAHLIARGFDVVDFGCDTKESVDYPDFVNPAAISVEKGENIFGILICGSGEGVAITANKHQEIRCALCWEIEVAELSRQHNNANMIALPARFITVELAVDIVDKFLNTDFEGGRHQNRVSKIATC